MRFYNFLNEAKVKKINMKQFKQDLNKIIQAPPKELKFKRGTINTRYNVTDADEIRTAGKTIKELLKNYNFTEAIGVPDDLKWYDPDEIFISPKGEIFIILNYIKNPRKYMKPGISIVIVDYNKFVEAGVKDQEELRKWIASNSSFYD